MPPHKNVPTLVQLCINSLTKFIIKNLDPHFLVKLKKHIPNHQERAQFHVNLRSIKKISNVLRESNLRHTKHKQDLKEEKKNHKDEKNKTMPVVDHEKIDYSNTSIDTMVDPTEVLVPTCTSPENQLDPPINVVQNYLLCLASDLTSHAHCSLQECLFSSILPSLNFLYMKSNSQEMRKLIRDIVPLFINPSLKVLNFGEFKMFTEALMFQVLYSRLKEAKGLERLIFDRSCYWRAGCILDISKTLEELSSLQVLHIHYICHPDMLQDLPQRCPQLRELSLKGSKDITDKEIPLIAQFSQLETLDITGTSVTGRGCRVLVEMPRLTWLMHCPFNCNSDTLIFESRAELFNYIKDQLQRQPILMPNNAQVTRDVQDGASEVISNQEVELNEPSSGEKMESGEAKSAFTLNLRFFWLFNSTTEEVFLTHLCPQLEHLRLDFVLQDLPEHPEMKAISHLTNLSSLSLYAFDMCPIQLITNVIEYAAQITTLHLHLGDEWFFVAPVVNVVAQHCRNLTCLKMEGDYKGQHSLLDSDSRLDFTLPTKGLSNLREARLAGCVTDQRVLHLLEQAPNLHTLYLDGELEWLHDDTFIEAGYRNLLLNLKELWFNVSAGVTFNTVRFLLQSKNEMERIGRLCLMSSATKVGYRQLLTYIRKHNLLTELIWVTDQRDLTLDTLDEGSE